MIQIGLVVLMIEVLLSSYLAPILYHGVIRSSILYLIHLLK
jgi:hypothetical protein